MFRYFIVILNLLFLFQICQSQVIQFGNCPEVEAMKFFNLEKFLGKWYEIQRFPTWYEDYGQCAYKIIGSCGRKIEIEHIFVRDGVEFVLHMNSTYVPGDEAIFVIKENNIDPVGIPLSVISTDYANYAVVYGCKKGQLLDLKYTWILAREKTLPQEILEKAFEELNSIPNANAAYLEEVEQREEKCKHIWTAHVQAVSDGDDEDNDDYDDY